MKRLKVRCFSRSAINRMTLEERKAMDQAHSEVYEEMRCAAEAHRQVV